MPDIASARPRPQPAARLAGPGSVDAVDRARGFRCTGTSVTETGALRALSRSRRRAFIGGELNGSRGGSSISAAITSAGATSDRRQLRPSGPAERLGDVGPDPDADQPFDADSVRRGSEPACCKSTTSSSRRCRRRRRRMAAVFTPARTFDTRSLRHRGKADSSISRNPEFTVRGNVRRTNRKGSCRTAAASVTAASSSCRRRPAWPDRFRRQRRIVRDRVLFRGRLHRILVPQRVHDRLVRQSIQATDTRPRLCGAGCLSAEQLVLGVNGLASVKLPYRSRATASVSVGNAQGRRRSADAADDQPGMCGAARTNDSERRSADDCRQPELRRRDRRGIRLQRG